MVMCVSSYYFYSDPQSGSFTAEAQSFAEKIPLNNEIKEIKEIKEARQRKGLN